MTENSPLQNISVYDRQKAEITGVREVLSFDDNQISLDTENGTLTAEGENLCVTKLDVEGGVIAFCGRIDSVYYSAADNTEKKSLFKRLFT